VSLLPFVFLVAALSVVIYVFGTSALDGASQVALLFAAGFTVALSMVLYRLPWNSCGMTQATVLKVATLEYLPYCFFNLLSPLMSIFIAAIGYKIVRKK
jgi:Na+/H+ antiporter NhaC